MGNKGQMLSWPKIIIIIVLATAIPLAALWQMGYLGKLAPADLGGITAPAKLGKLELSGGSYPIFCPASAEVTCDKTSYTANCANSNPDSINVVENSPTEDVTCGPGKFVMTNTGDGDVNNIRFTASSTNPNKVKGLISTGHSGWSGSTWTLSSIAAQESVTFDVRCAYEGGQTSANEKIDITFTGLAGSGAKSGYETVTASLNCTA